MVPFQTEFPVGDPVHERLHEERSQERRHYFNAVFHKPAGHVLVSKGIELQVDFAHDPHLGQVHIRLGQRVEFRRGFLQQLQQTIGVVGFDLFLGQFQIFVLQFRRFALDGFPDYGGVEELGQAVREQDGRNGDLGDLQPVDFEPGLVVLDILAGGQGNHRSILEAGCDQGMLDQAEVVGRPSG